MADKTVGRIPKPVMRRLLNTQIRRNLTAVAVTVTLGALYMKFIYGNGKKKIYADFYKNYDSDKEFERMRKKGLFQSCDPYDDD